MFDDDSDDAPDDFTNEAYGIGIAGNRKRMSLCGAPFAPCECNRDDMHKTRRLRSIINCEVCGGVGYLGVPVDDESLAATQPGHDQRVIVLSARRTAGLTLWGTP